MDTTFDGNSFRLDFVLASSNASGVFSLLAISPSAWGIVERRAALKMYTIFEKRVASLSRFFPALLLIENRWDVKKENETRRAWNRMKKRWKSGRTKKKNEIKINKSDPLLAQSNVSHRTISIRLHVGAERWRCHERSHNGEFRSVLSRIRSVVLFLL